MKSIGRQLLLFFSLLLFLISGVFGTFTYYTTYNAVNKEVKEVLPQRAEDVAKIVRGKLDLQLMELDSIAKKTEIVSMEWEQQKACLEEEMNRTTFHEITVIDPTGLAYYLDGKEENLSEQEYVRRALSGEPNFSDVIINPSNSSSIIMVATPIKKGSIVIGAIIAKMDANELSRITSDVIFAKTGYAYILNGKGTVIAHKNRDMVFEEYNPIETAVNDPSVNSLADVFTRMITNYNGFEEYNFNNRDLYLGYSRIQGTDWSVGVTAPKTEVLSALPSLQKNISVVSMVILAMGIIIVFIIGKSITKPIIFVTSYAEKMAQLDITTDISQKYKLRKDEVGRLSNAFQAVTDNLRLFIRQVMESTEQVAASSEELTAISEQAAMASEHISSSAGDMAVSSEKQLNEILNVSSSMEEISASIDDVSNNAKEISKLSVSALHKSNDGKEGIQRIILQMTSINSSTQKVQSSLLDITDSSKQMNEITNVIKGIAEQTNLLALNAAIEAARAGDQGKGFAVVADEVRKLAEQSQLSTNKINQLIQENQNNIEKANELMMEGSKNVEEGIEIVNITDKTFNEIATLISEVTAQIDIITSSILQVVTGSQEVVMATNEMEKMSQEVSGQVQNVSAATEEQTASMEEIAAASQGLSNLAQELQKAIGKFKI